MISHFLDASTWMSLRHLPLPVSQSGFSIFPDTCSSCGGPWVGKQDHHVPCHGRWCSRVAVDSALLSPPVFLTGGSFANLPLVIEDCTSWFCLLSIPSPVAVLNDFITHVDGGANAVVLTSQVQTVWSSAGPQ